MSERHAFESIPTKILLPAHGMVVVQAAAQVVSGRCAPDFLQFIRHI